MVRFHFEIVLPFSRDDFWRLRASPSFLNFIVADGLMKEMSTTPGDIDHEGYSTRIQTYCPVKVDCPPLVRNVVGDTMFAVQDYQRWNDHLEPYRQQFSIRPSFLSGVFKSYGILRLENFQDSSYPIADASSNRHGPEDPHLARVLCDADSCDRAASSTPMDDATCPESETVSEEHLSSAGASTDAESSDSGDQSDGSDVDVLDDSLDSHAILAAMPPSEKCRHIVDGDTRVSILTLGWFVERSIVHNLRIFYKLYPATVIRFRRKLYKDLAGGDESVPCSVLVDRLLASEKDLEETSRQTDVEEPSDLASDEPLSEVDEDNDLFCVE
eukprot:GFKZ01003515.1.p2 GENE.GFKZ01003515.1~~GFKZ01003515.1.p2  ORF type:complete len:328 (-),score=34.64 GFKZ01003515.1:2483-3466(-)